MWRKQKDDAGTVIVRRLTPKQIILLIIGLLIAITLIGVSSLHLEEIFN